MNNIIYNNNQLKMEVEAFIKNKIKHIKCVDDITLDYKFNAYVLPHIEFSTNYLMLLKKILQLSINVYNNYTFYKTQSVKFLREDYDDLRPLCYYYIYDKNDDLWRCNKCPEEAHLVEALYNYIICYTSIQITEMYKCDNAYLLNYCSFCNGDLTPDKEKCSLCDTLVEEMRFAIVLKKETKKPIIDKSFKINGSKDYKKIFDKITVTFNRFNLIIKEQKTNLFEVEKIKKEVCQDKWNCKLCLSEYSYETQPSLNNIEGLYQKSEWICEACNNKISSDESDDLKYIINENNIDNWQNIEEKKLNKRRNNSKWKCVLCSLFNSYRINCCESCGSLINENGRWVCSKCTFENKFTDSICEACFLQNDCLVIKYCQRCKMKKIKVNDMLCGECLKEHDCRDSWGRWKCRSELCGAWSEKSDDLCRNCTLQKNTYFDGLKRGDLVRRFTNGIVSNGWICWKCLEFNDETRETCKGWFCWESRYENVFCNNCQKYTNGKSNICRECQ